MRKKSTPFKRLLMGVLILIVIFIAVMWIFATSGKAAEEVVGQFYQYEQEGDFANSWELFHSSMKKKFTKSNYIQDRAHVFMNHFGVETFSYTLEKPEKIKTWRMEKTAPVLKNVYKVLVRQTYKGKYGHFDLEQEIYLVKEKGDWKIMWDYNK
ncbi:hypothetical protein [Neobacillus dielmonensis]|uniref:hypothetical protein n=1 Tax=Neobacillus dielmonensis TaxID=1347369 RepID=UPI0005A69DF5|nr:hypothetical protein [Neobacillus dielmonensis]